jgi:hypothetical protein
MGLSLMVAPHPLTTPTSIFLYLFHVRACHLWPLVQVNKEESIRVKVLQTLPLLLLHPSFHISSQFLAQALGACFTMMGDKSTILRHTAEATLKQVRCIACRPIDVS